MLRRRHSTLLVAAALLASLLGGGWALAEFSPILHERFEPDPKEDLALGVRITSARLPAALMGQSGPVTLPNPTRPIDRTEPTYGERQAAAPQRFRIDPVTADPGPLTYHEPFRPSIAPFKRTHVFDTVDQDFDLAVSEPRLRPVTLSPAPGAGDDQFFGDLVMDSVPGEWIRVPSVGANMAIYSAHIEPETPFGFYVDRADNWFLRAPEGRGRLRLVMHVGAARAFFDERIEASSYSELVSELPKVPANVEHVASQVLQRLGVSRVLSPADALGQLVTYFRGFAAAAEHPKATHGEALYRELVLSRKGVCRHRAYAFVVTSLGLGIPARFVHNEAHAWVEVFGGHHWHRIDLGGAAPGIEFSGDPPSGPAHQPPPEVFAWPKQERSAALSLPTIAQHPASGSQGSATVSSAAAPPSSAAPPAPVSGYQSVTLPAASAPGTAEPSPASTSSSARGRTLILVSLSTPAAVTRGDALGLTGRLESRDGHCGNVRVDVAFVRQAQRFNVGSFVTDADAKFATKLTVPTDLTVGDYDLVVSTPGSKDCPSASTD
jgi:hypothetical protein